MKIPRKGGKYKFYDNGKLCLARQFDAKVLRKIPKEEAKSIMFPVCNYFGKITTKIYNGDPPIGEKSLYDIWKELDKNVLYANDTDYFIECLIPRYDNYPIWFVRMVNGGWFSFEIQNYWQSGCLDVDGSLTNKMRENMKNYMMEENQ